MSFEISKEREDYLQFLNGMNKFERMLESSSLKHSKALSNYWFCLLRKLKSLGDREEFQEDYRALRRMKARMMKVMQWPYHPRYNPRGPRNENSDRLDKEYASRPWPF